MRVLLTGGAGYIGSHTALVLLERGHDVVVLDDYSNSSPEATRRVAALAGRDLPAVQADLTDPVATQEALRDFDFDAVVHFAGLKSVGESVAQPTRYYRVNLGSTTTLLELMAERGVSNLVFSSSATVYGDPSTPAIAENHQVGVGLTNPYGWSKFMNEQIIRDAQVARSGLSATLLRYFNPVGAHPSGQIGEDPKGPPNNLMPYIAQVASGRRARLSIFGSDYATADGTGVRDYIHVMDLAEGHVAALERAEAGVRAYNLGSGIGSSVIEAVRAFEHASGREVPFDQVARRPGDVAVVIADPALANTELDWRVSRTLDDACRDAWAWQSANPNGYAA